MWISCGLLWCYYQLFGLLFWRHPFTAEDPLVSKWCNAKFLKICSDEELIILRMSKTVTNCRIWGNSSSYHIHSRFVLYHRSFHHRPSTEHKLTTIADQKSIWWTVIRLHTRSGLLWLRRSQKDEDLKYYDTDKKHGIKYSADWICQQESVT